MKTSSTESKVKMAEQVRSLRSGFLRSSRRFAERPALEVKGRVLTYHELYYRAASLAGTFLRRAPKGEHPLTAVFGYRSETAFAGILAALFKGDGYVPLNCTFPPERTRGMLQRSGCERMIVDGESEGQLDEVLEGIDESLVIILPEREGVADLSERWERHTFLGQGDLESAEGWQPEYVAPEGIAYLLFTSGSTGNPKGVMVTHQNVVSFIDAMVERYGIDEEDRFSQMFEATFDLSVFDMFVAWERGGCVCCPSKKEVLIPSKYIRDAKISIWFSVPSTGIFMKSMGMLKPNHYPSIRVSLFCGEALPTEVVTSWREAAPELIIENLYGPTELTIACTLYRWDDKTSPAECEQGIVPIGEPYPGMTVLVADEQLREVAPGESGELLMAGPQRSQGYWQDPDKTAAAFVTPPGKKELYYRTGDRVRRPVNNDPLIYLGRMDHQIQIRGHRVELGEVEAVLRDEGETDMAVAIGWPITTSGADGIVGFLKTPKRNHLDIINRVKGKLPDYMVPKQLHSMNEIPMNDNGKVDRKALSEILRNQT